MVDPISTMTDAVVVRPDTTDFKSIFLSDAPMMDVRAPVEFDKGSFPTACNVPLTTDDERHKIGVCYKKHGREAAIKLGHKLVQGDAKAARGQQFMDFCRSNPNHGYLYCFRGGLRSQGVQQWIKEETGITYPLVTGGYKAMRSFLIEELELSMNDPKAVELIVVCGKTGSGKTLVIEALKDINSSLDLEGLAHHRGSAFGRLPSDPLQPSQIDFENSVSIAMLKLLNNPQPLNVHGEADLDGDVPTKKRIFVEDEDIRVGNVNVPNALINRMKACDGIVVVEESAEARAEVIWQDYMVDLRARFVAIHGEEKGFEMHCDYMLDALKRIRNRLGGDRYERVRVTMEAALKEEQVSDDMTPTRVLITELLEGYYDKMYDHHLAQRQDKILFRGTRDEVVEWARATAKAVESSVEG